MNMRKIIAVLAAVLLLCSVVPMGAMSVSAAPGDVILDINFDDGSNGGFDRSYNESGYIVFDATTGDWQNTYAYKNGLQTNVDYKVTFKAKANKDTTLNFKINDNWGPDAAAFTVNVTTEWQEFEGIINMASLSSAIVMFSSNATAADGAIYCIDDLKIVEYKEPLEVGVIANGNFENGSEGWTLNSAASIENGALKLDNPGQWAEAAMAEFAAEIGTEYTLSWKSQRISGTGAFLMFVLNADKTNHGTTGQNWMNSTSTDWVEHEVKFTATAENLMLKISPEVADAGVILIDDIKLTATPKAEVGKVTNGDFETGDATAWATWQSTEINAAAAYTGSYGANIIGNGGWGGMLDQHISVEDGKTYEFSFWFKVTSSGFNWSLKGDQTGASYGSGWKTTTEWTQVVVEFVANGDTSVFLNFNGGNTGVVESAYIDDVKMTELKEASNDGFVINGDFEIGSAAPWTVYSGSNVSAEAAKNGNYGLMCTNPTGGWGGTAFQDFTVTPGKTYEVTMWAKAISQGQNVQIQNGGANAASTWFNKTEWTLLSFEFTATDANVRINICGGGTNANEVVYFDDIKVVELIDPSFDGYIYNGDFETGEIFPWDNLWGSCPTVEIVEGMDGYGLHIVSGKWKHVRQTNIAVEANTVYKISLWAKNTSNMCMLVKDGGDSIDLCNKAIEGGDDWTYNEYFINTGDYTTIIVSLMGGEIEDVAQEGTFDNIVVEKHVHEHVLTDGSFPTCDTPGSGTYTCACGDSYTADLPAYHNGGMEYTPAKDAIDCQNPGNIEYYFCPGCYEYFADANAQEIINPWYIEITVDCVRPEGAADCAIVPCEVCGNDVYGYGEHDVLTCQGGTCSKCNAVIEGVGCANYDTPACQDGVCYYCGGFVAGFGHENGAWAPCCDGECSYGCGLQYPATEDHVDSDSDDYCDNCWNHLACVDADSDGFCDVCWSEMPVAPVIYGDANGDGAVNARDAALLQQYVAGWEVTLVEASADANGDGAVNARDAALLQQYVAGWEVTLG